MTNKTQVDLARAFLALHHGEKLLLLPNAWDVASARVFENAGFPAIATTSAGIAFALGYTDGQNISRDEMIEVVRRIANAVHVPVTADMEAGFGSTPEAVAETARRVLDAGAVGMNLEDGIPGKPVDHPDALVDLSLQTEIIHAVIEVSRNAGVPFVLNARTDIFLHSIGPTETRLSRTLERLNAFHKAGAQSVFVPGVKDLDTIGQIVRGVSAPLNILATAGTPPVAELQKLGVKRVSLGSGPIRATLSFLARMAHQLREQSTFSLMNDGVMTYAEITRLMQRKQN